MSKKAMDRDFTIYTDASMHDFVLGIAAVAVINGTIVGHSTNAYTVNKQDTVQGEFDGILQALSLGMKILKRDKLKNITIKVLCDNLSALKLALLNDKVKQYSELYRGRGCNLYISYVGGDDFWHSICHKTSNNARLKLYSTIKIEREEAKTVTERAKIMNQYGGLLSKMHKGNK